jgi:hypothetical protein
MLEDLHDEAKEVSTELLCTLGMAFLTGDGIWCSDVHSCWFNDITWVVHRLIMRVHQKKCSSTFKLVELSIGWQFWLTSLGSQKVLLMLNFWNKKLSRRLLIWMNQSCMVARLRLHWRGLMSLGWSSVHHAGITPTTATHIDHTEHRTSPHMVMGGLQDSAGQCATDLTSEVRGSWS